MNKFKLLSPVCGIDDFSFLYLALGDGLCCLKYTDLTITNDFDLILESQMIVSISKMLKHENIIRYFYSFVHEESLWSVCPVILCTMSHLVTLTLLTEKEAATVIKSVLKGLEYLHSKNWLHNDIRADNVLIDHAGCIKLSGLHQVSPLNAKRHQAWDFVQLPEWIAPELMHNTAKSVKSDIYSVGILTLELVHGKTPFHNWPPLKILVKKFQKLKITNVSRTTKNFVKQALKQVSNRPTAQKMQKHKFIKNSLSNDLFLQKIKNVI